MRPLLWLTIMVAGGVAGACLLIGAVGGPDCVSGVTSVACLGGWNDRWLQGLEVAASMAAAVVLVLALSTIAQMHRHHRLARALEGAAVTTVLADHEVGLVAGLTSPCAAGLAHARIYAPADLAVRLRVDELRAVILHERHHQLSHAPARLVLLAAARPLVSWIPGGSAWLERRRAALEIAADDHALRSGARRPALASALMKLAGGHADPSLAGYASASELRLRHLVGEESSEGMRSRALLAFPIIALIGCLIAGFHG